MVKKMKIVLDYYNFYLVGFFYLLGDLGYGVFNM